MRLWGGHLDRSQNSMNEPDTTWEWFYFMVSQLFMHPGPRVAMLPLHHGKNPSDTRNNFHSNATKLCTHWPQSLPRAGCHVLGFRTSWLPTPQASIASLLLQFSPDLRSILQSLLISSFPGRWSEVQTLSPSTTQESII